KAAAARELAISLSTLDRKIRRGEVEVVREGRRVYVRLHGPEQLSDEELLRRASIRVDELERTVRGLERERDEARDAAAASSAAYEALTEAYRKERVAHDRTRRLALRRGLIVAALVVLLVIGVLVAWRLFT
ncbi:MAG: hypothetical protein OXU67_09460, partial [Chloroflexota bacterium]|nr:hypothetical protein [Chloroflexota bacterium]